MVDYTERYAGLMEASRYLGVTHAWVCHLIEAGQLRADRGPHGWLIDRESLAKLAQERRENPPRPGRKSKPGDRVTTTIDDRARIGTVLPPCEVPLESEEVLIQIDGDKGRALITERVCPGTENQDEEARHGNQ